MQQWFASRREGLARQLSVVLRNNIVHNRSSLPPFRLPQIGQQILSGLETFFLGKDVAGAVGLGSQLAEQGLGLRSLFAIHRALLNEGMAQSAPASEPAEGPAATSERLTQLTEFLLALADGVAACEGRLLTRQRDEIQTALERVIADREGELRRLILELSTPIMPLFDQILVLPLVGAIDRERASRIMERLLEEVVAQKARVVIVDITGVPTVEAETASALMRTAQSVQLLGARVILAGIRPDIAQALSQAGFGMDGIITQANLQRGVEHALRLKGLALHKDVAAPINQGKP